MRICATRWAKRGRFQFALLVAAAISAGAAQGGELPRVDIVAYGIYAPSSSHGRMPPNYRQDAIVEVTQADMPRLIARTGTIELRPCARFGLEYRASNLPPDDVAAVEVRVEHPMLTRPDGRRSTLDTYEIPLRSTTGWTGFDFDEAWEMVPGPWTFSLSYRGHALASQRFAVIASPAGSGELKACSPAVA